MRGECARDEGVSERRERSCEERDHVRKEIV